MSEKMSREDFKRRLLAVIQPMYRGTFNSISGLSANLKNLIPFGTGATFQHASPYGLISAPIAGVLAYFINLLGNAQAPVILNHLDGNRPVPNSGETILYCLNSDGSMVPVKATLQPGGTFKLEATTVNVIAPTIHLGSAASAENLVLGQQLKTLLAEVLQKLNDMATEVAAHTHEGNLGYATSPPIDAATFTLMATSFENWKSSPVNDETILSGKAFTEK